MLFVGALIGYALSIFTTPKGATIALALGMALLVVRLSLVLVSHWKLTGLARSGLLALPAIMSGGLVWLGMAWLLTDSAPPLKYSLMLLRPDEVVPLPASLHGVASGDVYQFRIENGGDGDVSDVHITVDLPTLLLSPPVVINATLAEDVRTKPVFFTMVKTPRNGETTTIPGYTNGLVVDVHRLLAGGALAIAALASPLQGFCTTSDETDGAGRDNLYGVVKVTRRHIHYGEEVTDHETFPIARVGGPTLVFSATPDQRDLLNTSQHLPLDTRSLFSPGFRADEIAPGTAVSMHIEPE